MTGYKEVVGEELNLGYPLFQRIHNPRPLIPKPYLSSPNYNHINNSYLNRLPHNHHGCFGTKGEEGNNNNNNNKEGSVAQVMVSSRWNPTPEQLTALEELYRCGTRTPSAEQIQHITAQLGRYGKIEGKNVFYWFQNHKARERQKRRRQLQLPLTSSITTIHANHSRDNAHKGPGATRIGFQDEEKSCKRTPFITNNKEYDPPIESEAGPRKADKSSSNNGWFQFHETCAEFQHNNNLCQKDLILLEERNVNNNLQPSSRSSFQLFSLSSQDLNVINLHNNSPKTTSSVTLQLFPILEQDDDDDLKKKEIEIPSLDTSVQNTMSCMDSNDFVPYYQFL